MRVRLMNHDKGLDKPLSMFHKGCCVAERELEAGFRLHLDKKSAKVLK